MIRLAILLLALGATACGGSTTTVGAQLSTPSAIAVFRGVTERRPGVEAYVAVANSGNDQLTLVDPRDDRPVPSPGLVFPLAIPTDASPMFLAAASLADGGADALIVAGAPDPETGEVGLQLVSTWDGRPRPVAPFPGGAAARGFPVASGGEVILSLAGLSIPQDAPAAGGVVPPVQGAARFLVSLSGGRLAVVRAIRQADGSIQLADEGSVLLGGAAPFDALSLSASPDGRHAYAASPDLVTGTDGTAAQGVAELDTLGDDPSAWTVRALDARATTYGVAAARVVERRTDEADGFVREQLTGSPRLLVYALTDRSTCGPTRAIDCGVVTIDPVTGTLAEDPLGEMPYRPPMVVPVLPVSIATWDRPPAVGSAADLIAAPADGANPLVQVPGLRYTPGTGQRPTSSIGLVAGADGFVYSLDLGRWGPGSDQSLLRAPSQTRAQGLIDLTDPNVEAQVGIWREVGPGTGTTPPQPVLELTPDQMIAQMLVTPGYTPDDRWALGFQLPLAGLQGRRSVLVRDGALGLVLAMQVPEDVGGATLWRESVGLYAPQLGVHVDDVVELQLDDVAAVPDACVALGEARIAELLPPDPRWPGGALRLAPPVDPDVVEGQPPREQVFACWASQLAAGVHPATSSVLAAEWVLQGASFGYAGRPVPDVRFRVDYPGAEGGVFVEEQLAAACAIPSWPPPEPVPACDAACREACEQLAIARRARRFYYPQEDCRDSGQGGVPSCSVTGRPGQFPESLLIGPVVEFRFGLNPASVTAQNPIVRQAQIQWTTFSGLSPSFRGPTIAGQATGVVGFDRSPYTNAEPRIVFYVSYTGDAVFEAAFGAFATESVTIR